MWKHQYLAIYAAVIAIILWSFFGRRQWGITSACAPGIKPTLLVCLEANISYLPIYWYLNFIIADLGETPFSHFMSIDA